jgi:hypothetical protein
MRRTMCVYLPTTQVSAVSMNVVLFATNRPRHFFFFFRSGCVPLPKLCLAQQTYESLRKQRY